jgi:LmbE family N-acetylglucosaminyl deacetylase
METATMRILYIFPHPDDESFGVGHVMHRQRRQGHEVHLLTLTRGGATKQRHKYGYSVAEMGEVRYREMLDVERVLGLSGMTVLDLVDSGLKEADPRTIEAVIATELERLRPQVVVSYPVHGISGFHDHLVTHAVVKRAFVEQQEALPELARLAFCTLTKEQAAAAETVFPLSSSKPDEIDCLVRVEPEDIEACRRALDCYETFRETIEKTGIKDSLFRDVPFELYGERHDPPIDDLFHGLAG